jgi:uncharacterized protein (TIGR02145 family)
LTYDGRTYDLVEIGGQCWFADNLATDQYSNGDPIPTGLDNATWSTTTSGAFAIHNNNPANDAAYGKIYNWFTTIDDRGLCPSGWHVPTDCEWMYLESSLGMLSSEQVLEGYRGTVEGGELKSTSTWIFPNTGATNESNFNGLPGGTRIDNGNFGLSGYFGNWWTSSSFGPNISCSRSLAYDNSGVFRSPTQNKQNGFSIRCIKN